MSGKWSDNLNRWDRMLKSGQAKDVHGELLSIPFKSISWHHRRRVASFFRRIGDFHRALLVITPNILTPESEPMKDVNPDDLCEYAVILNKVGLQDPAIGYLTSLNPERVPKRDLFLAFCHFGRLDYGASLPHLEAYLENPDLPPYDRLIGEVNYLNALIETGNLSRALKLSEILITKAAENGHRRLAGNCKELKARTLIYLENFETARELLTESLEELQSDSQRYQMITRKWLSYIESLKIRDKKPLQRFRDLALEQKKHSMVREADVLGLKIIKDSGVFEKLYFGTHHQLFRQQLQKEHPDLYAKLPLNWSLGSGQPVLDLQNGELNGKALVPKGRKLHLMLNALFDDLYEPVSIYTLHSRVFQGEVFNVFYATNKIKQLLFRLRSVFADHSVPIELHHQNSHVQTIVQPGVKVIFALSSHISSPSEVKLDLIESRWGNKLFSRQDAEQILSLSAAQTKRVLAELVEVGLVIRVRDGRKIRYKLSSGSISKAS